jgi:hypothetical protein
MNRRALAAALLLSLPLFAQQSESWTVEVPGSQNWVDTKIDVAAGDLVKFGASGEIKYADAAEAASPDGLRRGWTDMIRILPMNDSGRGALIARIGEGEQARPFLVGKQRESRMPVAGRLFLGLNHPRGRTATGSFTVVVTRVEKAGAAAEKYTGPLPAITDEILDKIPRRVVDPDGTPGDRVNFLILGKEDQIKNALFSTGWVIVDRTVKDTVLRGALGVLSKEAYLTMPMSELQMFGRPQDYGFAHSDPLVTVAARHHFRLWKAPFDVEGQDLWVGAGTHDVGFDKDQRNGKITHKIDPDTDKEREYIGDTLFQSGQVVKRDYVTPKDTVTKAKTAHGQEYFSDGRILVVYMKPDTSDVSKLFGDYFCSVLKQNNPDGENFGDCSQWISSPGRSDLPLGAIPNTYRLLVIPGIMNTCVDVAAFDVGRRVLEEKYGVKSEILAVPNNSSEENAEMIASYLRKQWIADKRRYIVFGYSKGTPDLQVTLATKPDIRESVAAFVSVAGASGGSPIADSIPMQADRYLSQAKKGNCQGDLSKGFKSLQRAARQRFLNTYPHPFVPTYSLVALSDENTTSKGMIQTWKLLNSFERLQDGQLLRTDSIIPESLYLGAIKADHLAAALDFSQSQDSTMKGMMDKARYPRGALYEALVRFVIDDLAKRPAPAAPAQTKPASGWGEPRKN